MGRGPAQVSARIHAVDVIGGTLFAAAITLLIALGLCNMLHVALLSDTPLCEPYLAGFRDSGRETRTERLVRISYEPA
jgi:hypothetical protein